MLSNFGHSDGGRETWAYGFIPLLINFNENLYLTIYGLNSCNESDNTKNLINIINPIKIKRIKIVFFNVKWKKIPLFFSMFYEFKKYLYNNTVNRPKLALGVGGLFEMLLLVYAPVYQKTTKVLWLRTIFCHEKANKIPSFLLPLFKKFELYIIKKADILIANGDDIAAHYKQYGLQIHVIKNGVNMKKWSMHKPILSNPIKVAFIGRLAEVKGIIEFLQLIKIVKKKPNASLFEFHIIGHGPYINEIKILEQQNMLFYHGLIDNNELPKLLVNYDICVALTLEKKICGGGGTSNALLEQMAAGRIIIAWDNSIFRQLLNDKNAYLVKQGDIKGLVKTLNDIVTNKEKAYLKAFSGKSLVSNYSVESQISKFYKIIS